MLLETIHCVEGSALHLTYHQQRLEHSLQLLGIDKQYDLKTLITPPNSGIFRCRFLYDAHSYMIEFHPYVPKSCSSLKLVYADDVEYPLKYTHRDQLNLLFDLRGECDDVLIVRNGYLSDTTIANIALKIDAIWFTPDYPLLQGTTRARLLESGFLQTAPLRVSDLERATSVAVMNAMVGFIEVEHGIITEK